MNKNKNAAAVPVTPGANPEAMQADLNRRRSSAGSPHDSRPRRQRSRRDSRRAAIRDSRG